MKQCSTAVYTLNTIATATNGVYPFLQDKLQRVVQIKQEAHQMLGNNDIAWSSGLNDDDLNAHLVWPQWCAVTVQVLNQLGERDHYTQTMRGEMKRP